MYRRLLIVSVTIALSCGVSVCASAPLRLTQDINPGAGNGVNSFSFFPATDYLLFWGIDGSNGINGNPYLSNGTTSGTGLIKTISGSSADNFPGPFAAEVNNVQLFGYNDGINNRQLWRTDGTVAGTSRLTTFTLNHGPNNFLPIGSTLFFTSSTNCTLAGVECVWSTDGTAAATLAMVNSNVSSTPQPTVVMQSFVFSGRPTNGGPFGLFVSNGTEAGSTLLISASLSSGIVAVNDKVYFVASDATNGTELWVSDLTQSVPPAAATHLVLDINPGNANSNPKNLTRVGDLVFFTAIDPSFGRELWRSDGTPAGTVMVKDIRAGLLDAAIVYIDQFKSALGKPMAFFFANDGTHGLEPWISDGTLAGTFALGDINLGAADSRNSLTVTVGSGNLYFSAQDGSGAHVWSTDGSVIGTKVVDSSVDSAVPERATDGHLFVPATAGLGQELYQMDLLSYESLPPHGSMWCARPEKPILDLDTITSRVRFPTHGGMTNLDFVTLDLGHTFVGDLKISLTHEETGTQVTLLDRPKNGTLNCAGDLIDISLSDGAATAVNTSCTANRNAYTPGGQYRPLQGLSAFPGEPVKGHWTLTVTDNVAGDSGTLHQWCLGFQHDYIFADDVE